MSRGGSGPSLHDLSGPPRSALRRSHQTLHTSCLCAPCARRTPRAQIRADSRTLRPSPLTSPSWPQTSLSKTFSSGQQPTFYAAPASPRSRETLLPFLVSLAHLQGLAVSAVIPRAEPSKGFSTPPHSREPSPSLRRLVPTAHEVVWLEMLAVSRARV